MNSAGQNSLTGPVDGRRAMGFRIRQSRSADAPLLPAIEREAGELFQTIPSLAFIADGDDRSVAEHLAHIAAGTSWVATDDADAPIGFVIADVSGAGSISKNWPCGVIARDPDAAARCSP